jgi:hypothetical protein
MVEVTWSGSGRQMSGGERGRNDSGRDRRVVDVSGGQVSSGSTGSIKRRKVVSSGGGGVGGKW